jgi:hypothetical protein
MRMAFYFAIGICSGSIAFAQAVLQENTERRIVKPAPPVVTPFELKVETTPRFPNENRPEASTPVEDKSLAVTLQPEKTEFAGNGPLAFLVTFENKSKSQMMLFGLEHLGGSPKLVLSNQTNANQWSITGKFDEAGKQAAVKLGPGESNTYTLVVEANVIIVPQPIPLPRPIPVPARPVPEPGIQKALPEGAQADRRIWPPRPPVVIGPALPVGEGDCRAKLFLEFQTDPARRYEHPTWMGKIATGTVEFKIGKSQPVPVPPIGGGPLTKERAIPLAKAAAERALQANYQPAAGLKPAHQGEWITEAEKTANVTEKKAGGWTIGWTHFPKKGFSYNVKIDVTPAGRAVVREVFASYSE